MNIIIQKFFMDQRLCENKNKGYAALMGVLIVGAVGLAISLMVIVFGTDSLRATNSIQDSAQARSAVNLCLEEALQEIRNSMPFEGTGDFVLNNSACSFEVIVENGQNRTIQAIGEAGTSIVRVKVEIDSINPNINITSWKEVADF